MAIQRNDFAVRIFTVIGVSCSFFIPSGAPVCLSRPKIVCCLERRPIPELHVKLDNSAPPDSCRPRSSRLVLIGCHPHYLIHQRCRGSPGCGAVLKPQQVDRGLLPLLRAALSEINRFRFQRTLSRSGVCLMTSRRAWITVS